MYNDQSNPYHARLNLFVSAILVIAGCLGAAAGPAQAAGEKAEAPQIKVGDRWKTEQKDKRTGIKESEITRTVTAVSANTIEGSENDGAFKMTVELNPLESTTTVIAGDAKFLNFPIEVGKKWSFKYNFANKINQGKGRSQLDAEVVAYEKVTVPAGSFDAFRIETKGFWNNEATRGNGRSKSIYWYAPAARSVVRTEYEDGFNNWVRELTELNLQP